MARFQKGQSGNPLGRPRGSTDFRSQLRENLTPHAPALLSKAVELALAGDVQALRICLDRIVPSLKAQDLPAPIEGATTGTILGRAESIVDAMISGRVTPSEASTMLGGIASLCKIKETEDLEVRLAALEAAQQSGR